MLVQAWQASDGSLHKTEKACNLQEDKIKAEYAFNELYNKYACYGKIELTNTQDLRELVQAYPELFQYWIDIMEGE